MASVPYRNPLTGFVLAIFVSFLGSALAGYFVSTYVPYLEFRLFFLGFGLFAVGAIAARRTFLGSLGFVGCYLGGFLGLYVAELLWWFNSYQEIVALGLALGAGAGGFVMSKLGVHRLERAQRVQPGVRRCANCGARVGTSAHKCWSCKATLTY
ncbi:MAG TPA: hypothetical protein VEY12_06485 [Thermoplasmata archaeon]|nr:hypothetical protein [Thermoplasmata archaeon]